MRFSLLSLGFSLVLQAQPARFTAPSFFETVERSAPGRAATAITERQTPVAISPTIAFDGIGLTGGRNPPHPEIAAGPEDILLAVSSSIARYSRTGTPLTQVTLNEWFASLITTICPNGGTAGCTITYPTLRYDAQHGRFLVLAYSEETGTRKTWFLLSVSNGATLAQGFKHYALEGSRNNTTQSALELDSPQLGYDSTAVYLTANMINPADSTVQYAKIRILKKSELYNPNTTTLTHLDLWDLRNEDNSRALNIQPAVVRGRPSDNAASGILINAANGPTASYLTLWRIANPTSTSPTATRSHLTNIWTYTPPATFLQKDSSLAMSAGDNRVLRAIRRDNILYIARNSGYSDEPTTYTTDRIDLTNNRVTAQGRAIGGSFFFPAFEIPATHGTTNGFPGSIVSGSTVDAAGALTYLSIHGVKAGEDRFDASPKWGDSFGAAIDPSSGGLWTYGQYALTRGSTTGRWATHASFFPLTSNAAFTDVPTSNPFSDAITVLKLWGVTTGCTPSTYCPGDSVTRGQIAVFIVRALLGENFTFPTTPFFTDVPNTHPFFKYIQKFRDLGIANTCATNQFCPESTLTRADMAIFLVRGKLTSLYGDTFPVPAIAYFTDVTPANTLFPFVQKLRELGITSGCTASTYCPADPVTREQMAIFLGRAFLF
ncbi:MAG: S-layer homology domain-containing protein [Bryobacterales bacterium]|nr:S-layer homology domain-containing protein [Bryobacterales bacterium]